ncbi:uncharacterized protein LOC135693983 [Rhopilema esculentum]|uniref:uncharacterized protein LOC135693983 n=1 Tax=Rhopilema esculentum TaxID=499914 RepID=UPI0031E10681|eukprot:gene10666-19416_t
MGCNQSKPFRCPRCDHKFVSSDDILYHIEKQHPSQNLSCPKCNLKGFKDCTDLIKHVEGSHSIANMPNEIVCSKCNQKGFKDGAELLNHYEQTHVHTPNQIVKQVDKPVALHGTKNTNHSSHIQSKPNKVGNKSLPRVGDKVLAMWEHTKWQYFDATIRRFLHEKLQYEIDWDDQDTTGRFVDYFNLALDRSPDPNEISIGSIILFQQGSYSGSAGGATAGVRWHEGKITHIRKNERGERLFDGCHTKGMADGKWITYGGYNYTFAGKKLEELRIGPNVFDILDDLDSEENGLPEDDIDIYFSYSVTDSPTAIKNNETLEAPERYLPVLDRLCDPRDIMTHLRKKGLKIGERKANTGEELKKTAIMMKKAKVFVACISDQYVANNECRMEFQYAKTTLGTPIVPLVVGDGSFDWTLSVVGMLIAGELYIHFKDRTVENDKLTELLQALKAHFGKIADITSSGGDVQLAKGEADIFLSYNWTNSQIAEKAKQITGSVGNEFSDPRLVKNELQKAGFNVWIDIERLRSANQGAGMYEQLTKALKDCKVFVPCVSLEYANSPNCRMEFQFAMKSLKKPVVPIIVGKGDQWTSSVIGALIAGSGKEAIDFQDAFEKQTFTKKLEQCIEELNKALNIKSSPTVETKNVNYRAPKVGDHVVCHHFNCAYYMATVESFNTSTLEYTVNWDDGDPSGRVQPYNQVALDLLPDSDDVGVGSIIFFPQGNYKGTEGNNTGGERYHEGIVTSSQISGNTKLISGHHTKGAEDSKWVTYRDYSYEFTNLPLKMIRMAPSAMDALQAAKQ